MPTFTDLTYYFTSDGEFGDGSSLFSAFRDFKIDLKGIFAPLNDVLNAIIFPLRILAGAIDGAIRLLSVIIGYSQIGFNGIPHERLSWDWS